MGSSIPRRALSFFPDDRPAHMRGLTGLRRALGTAASVSFRAPVVVNMKASAPLPLSQGLCLQHSTAHGLVQLRERVSEAWNVGAVKGADPTVINNSNLNRVMARRLCLVSWVVTQ